MAGNEGRAATAPVNLHAIGVLGGNSGDGGGGSAAAQGIEQLDGGAMARVAGISNTQLGSLVGGEMSAPAASLSTTSSSLASYDMRDGFGGLCKIFENMTGEVPDNLSGIGDASVDDAPVDTSGSNNSDNFEPATGGGNDNFEPASGGGGGGDDFQFRGHSGNFEMPDVTPMVTGGHHVDHIGPPSDVGRSSRNSGMEMDF